MRDCRQPVHRLGVVGRPIRLAFRLGLHALPAAEPAGPA